MPDRSLPRFPFSTPQAGKCKRLFTTRYGKRCCHWKSGPSPFLLAPASLFYTIVECLYSWNEVKDRALKFTRQWAGETSERAEAKTFWDEFFDVFGIRRRGC